MILENTISNSFHIIKRREMMYQTYKKSWMKIYCVDNQSFLVFKQFHSYRESGICPIREELHA